MMPFSFWPEMLNYPFFLHLGWLPYRDWSSVYTPVFLYLMKFFYDLFGYTAQTYQLITLLLLAVTTFLVWKFSRSIFALAFFVPAYLAFGGNAVWFDMFLAPLVLLLYVSQNSLLVSFIFGVAVLSKQTAFYLLPVVYKDLIKKPLPLLVLLGGFLFYLVFNNLLADFYRWGVEFVFLLPKAGDLALPTVKQGMVVLTFIIAIFATKNRRAIVFAFFTLLFAFPRFEFFHLIPFLTVFTVTVAKKPWLFLIPIIPVFLLLHATFSLGNRFLEPTVLEVAADIKNNYQNQSIFSLNGPDQIYFLTGKPPAVRPWVDQLPWQLAFAKEAFYLDFVKTPPDIIITRPYLAQPVQGLGAYRPQEVWNYVDVNYHPVKTYADNTQILERN